FVLLRVLHFAVTAVDDLDGPLDAREVHAPLVAFPWWRRPMGKLSQRFPGEGNLDTPAEIAIFGFVQRAFHKHSRSETGDFPTVHGGTAVFVRLLEEQIPAGVQRVYLELVIVMTVPVRVDKDFEVG